MSLVDNTGRVIPMEDRAVFALESLAASFAKIADQFVRQSELGIKAQEESLTLERERLVGLKKQQEQLAGITGAMGEFNVLTERGVASQEKITEAPQRIAKAAAPPREPWQPEQDEENEHHE